MLHVQSLRPIINSSALVIISNQNMMQFKNVMKTNIIKHYVYNSCQGKMAKYGSLQHAISMDRYSTCFLYRSLAQGSAKPPHIRQWFMSTNWYTSRTSPFYNKGFLNCILWLCQWIWCFRIIFGFIIIGSTWGDLTFEAVMIRTAW
jgi:hypothetical protein